MLDILMIGAKLTNGHNQVIPFGFYCVFNNGLNDALGIELERLMSFQQFEKWIVCVSSIFIYIFF